MRYYMIAVACSDRREKGKLSLRGRPLPDSQKKDEAGRKASKRAEEERRSNETGSVVADCDGAIMREPRLVLAQGNVLSLQRSRGGKWCSIGWERILGSAGAVPKSGKK